GLADACAAAAAASPAPGLCGCRLRLGRGGTCCRLLRHKGCAVQNVARNQVADGELTGFLTGISQKQVDRHARINHHGAGRRARGYHATLNTPGATVDRLDVASTRVDNVDAPGLDADGADDALADRGADWSGGKKVDVVVGVGKLDDNVRRAGGGGGD